MRLLMLNPNTSTGVTDLIVAAAEAVAAPETQIVPATAPRGVPYIATRAEAVIGGAIALEMLAELHEGVDAAVMRPLQTRAWAAPASFSQSPLLALLKQEC